MGTTDWETSIPIVIPIHAQFSKSALTIEAVPKVYEGYELALELDDEAFSKTTFLIKMRFRKMRSNGSLLSR